MAGHDVFCTDQLFLLSGTGIEYSDKIQEPCKSFLNILDAINVSVENIKRFSFHKAFGDPLPHFLYRYHLQNRVNQNWELMLLS